MFLTSRRNSSREKERSSMAGQQDAPSHRTGRQLLFSELANSHGHYAKGSLSGLTQSQGNKLKSSTTASLLESQTNVCKLTPETAACKISEKLIQKTRPQGGLESRCYQLKSATSVDFIKDLLEGQMEKLTNTGGSQADLLSLSPQLATSQALNATQNEPDYRLQDLRPHTLCSRPSAEDICSLQPYSNSHLGQIMDDLKMFVNRKDFTISKLESENKKLRAVLASHGIPFPEES